MKKGKMETINLFGPENVTAQQRKDTMALATEKGCACPVCDQFVKVYKRGITSTMARQLIHAWRCHGTMTWFHLRDVVMDGSGAGDFSKLVFWELIQQQWHEPGEHNKKTSGIWRITQKGEDFLHGKIKVPAFAAVYNGKVLEFQGDDEGIHEALGNKFDYKALMNPVPLQKELQ